MNGADIIAGRLAAAGCRFAFGIPGGEVLALMEALDHAGLKFILTKHENAAGFMAEGVWHAQSATEMAAPGILLATIGPGVANAVNVVANALQDRVPLIFLTGCVDGAEAETYTHQVFDHQALLRPVVKGSFRASQGAIGPMIEKAIALSLEGQPGPVHVDVPISVAEGVSSEVLDDTPPQIIRPDAMLATGPVLQEAKTLLAQTERPLAIAGVDAVNENAGKDITEFCEYFGIPLITTYKGKGLMDERHPLCLGGAGLSPKADNVLMPLIAEADLILVLGYDPIEMRIGWRDPWDKKTNAVEITSMSRSHGMHSVSHELRGGLKPILSQLKEGPSNSLKWENGAPTAARNALKQAFVAETEEFGPGTVFDTLRRVFPENTLATADSGAHRILASQMWECFSPRGMIQSSALCTMGCALPMGIGHMLAAPDRPSLVFVGDAGLEMGLGELATLRDLKLPVVVCVLVDASLALIEMKQRNSQRPNVGVDFDETNFPALAMALGGHGVWVDNNEDLEREAGEALQRETFTVLACRISRRAYDGKF
ncbi:MAG: thiamine pyrophosphate-binding protein [Stappiaceae bacterium]